MAHEPRQHRGNLRLVIQRVCTEQTTGDDSDVIFGIFFQILSDFSTRSLLSLKSVSHRFHALGLRVLHYRLLLSIPLSNANCCWNASTLSQSSLNHTSSANVSVHMN
ncbi:hypothetical protein PITC_023090 [Penicillium italicum]|uniref:F-box domain-containing protein n=1 Tax=Penicillium italicum TaxID=40296 RepID=A0A0A2K9E6_PENIT|nr:hypothetical protein PITC_023090 [Penicillium italicum]